MFMKNMSVFTVFGEARQNLQLQKEFQCPGSPPTQLHTVIRSLLRNSPAAGHRIVSKGSHSILLHVHACLNIW